MSKCKNVTIVNVKNSGGQFMNWKTCILIVVIGLLATAVVSAQPTFETYDQDMLGTAYVDAYTSSETSFNIWPTDAASYPLLSDWLLAPTDPYQYYYWWPKTASTKTINGDCLQGRDFERPPQLTMTVTGLDNTKTYDVYVVYWGQPYAWCTWASLSGGPWRECTYQNADNVFLVNTVTGATGGGEAFVGQVTGQTELSVLFEVTDNHPLNPNHDARAWVDGISYTEAAPRALVTLTINAPIVQDTNGWGYTMPAPEEFPITPSVGTHTFLQGQTATLVTPPIGYFVNCPDYFEFVGWQDETPGDPNIQYHVTSTGAVNYLYNPWITLTASKTLTPIFKVMEVQGVCGDDCHPIPKADFNQDCIVDLMDFAVLSRWWLDCTHPSCD